MILLPPVQVGRDRTIRSVIRDLTTAIAWHRYDWDGKLGLPLRDDVRIFLLERFTATTRGPRIPPLGLLKSLCLEPDGTVTIVFAKSNRKLILEFPCMGVIVTHMIFADGVTVISGTHRLRECGENREEFGDIDDLFDWIKTGEMCAKDR